MNPEVRTNPSPAKRPNPPTTVLLARRLDVHPERVFDAWLDPAKVRKWIVAASPEDEIKHIEIDPRIGGTFSFLVVRQNVEIDHIGGYVEIDRPRRLAFTWNPVIARDPRSGRNGGTGSLVTLDFAPAGSGTELRLTHEGVAEEYAIRTEDGWSKIIQALANAIGP